MLISIIYNGQNYNFIKNQVEPGYWVPSSGPKANMVVPRILAHQLRLAAQSQGFTNALFDAPQKPEKIKSISLTGKTTKSKTSISLGDFLKSQNKGE